MAPSKDAALAEEEVLTDKLAKVLKKSRPALTAKEYISLLEPIYDQFWSHQDEENLMRQRSASRRYEAILNTNFTKTNTAAVMLWRVFPCLYHKLPTDLICKSNKIGFDLGSVTGDHNVMWSKGFCDALAAFTINPFWMWEAEADFPLMAQVMQLVVRCRTNDCRVWEVENPTCDRFIDELIVELSSPNNPDNDSDSDSDFDAGRQDRTMTEIVDSVVARLEAGSRKIRRPTEMQCLFQAVVAKAFRGDKNKIIGEYRGREEYLLTTADIELLNDVLSEFGPCPDRRGLRERLPVSAWKRMVNRARGKKAQSDALPQNKDIANVISLSMICQPREDKIAKRKATGYTHPASVPAFEPPTIGAIWGDSRPFLGAVEQEEEEEEEEEDAGVGPSHTRTKGKTVTASKTGHRSSAVSVASESRPYGTGDVLENDMSLDSDLDD